MAIQFRKGTKNGFETNYADIVAGEPVLTTDSKQVFVGTGNGEYLELANADDLNDIQDAVIELENRPSGVPTSVRSAFLTLFESAAYATTGLEDEIAIVEAWATEVTSLTLSASELSLNSDVPSVIVATTIPNGASVTWTSSNENVAVVNGGIVTGVSNGSCVITASAGDLSATCEVEVEGFAELVSISAVYTQSGTVYDTDSLDSLKDDLVVTATYNDSSTEIVTTYTLSGTLEVGTSTVYVSYGGKATTFSVTVSVFTWSYTDGLPADNGLKKEIRGTCTETMTTSGVRITASNSSSQVIYTRTNGRQKAFLEYVVNVSTNNSNHYAKIATDSYANGIRVQYSSNYKGIYFRNGSTLAESTLVQSIDLNTDYKIKLVINGDKGDIYVNDVLKLSNIDLSTNVSVVDSTAYVSFTAAGSTSANTLFKSCTIGAL